MAVFTKADMEKLGLVEGADGKWSKPVVKPQPRVMHLQQPAVEKKKELKVKKEKPPVKFEIFRGLNETEIQQYATKCGAIYIPGEVISKKNSKRIFHPRGKKHPIIANSPQAMRYINETKKYYEQLAPFWKHLTKDMKFPIKLHLLFVRSSARIFDYNNIGQMVQDMMVEHDWIPDDDYRYIIPEYAPFGINSRNPGVIITPHEL